MKKSYKIVQKIGDGHWTAISHHYKKETMMMKLAIMKKQGCNVVGKYLAGPNNWLTI